MKPGNLRRVSPPANGRMGRMFFVCLFVCLILLCCWWMCFFTFITICNMYGFYVFIYLFSYMYLDRYMYV